MSRNFTAEVSKAVAALDAARARFYPEVSLQARYTRAAGGREFVLPLGTALNPVYSTLNDILEAQGQPAQFPQLSDVSVQFLRENLRVNESLFSNGKITEDQVLRARAELLQVSSRNAKSRTSRHRLAVTSISCSIAICSRKSSPPRRRMPPPTGRPRWKNCGRALNRRPEIAQLEQLKRARRMRRRGAMPSGASGCTRTRSSALNNCRICARRQP